MLTLLFWGVNSNAQDFSNKGKEFWIAYPAHIDGTGSVMGIYITSDENASGTISYGGITIPFAVTANQVTRKFLGSSGAVDGTNVPAYLSTSDGIQTNAGIHIVSDKAVVVYSHIIRSARSGATLVLPVPVLGTEYLVPSYQSVASSNNSANGEVAIIATQANTVVEITPSIKGIAGKPAGTKFQITLANPGDAYQFQGTTMGDLSGTVIKSIGCKPIAVFSATTWSVFDCGNAGSGDNLYQQLFPTRSWGKQFITAPFINRPYDIYRIYVQDPSAQITVTDNGITKPLSGYNSTGRFYEYKTSNPVFINSDQPISVAQYIVSQACKSGCNGSSNNANQSCMADPEMILLNPVEQTLKDVTFFSAHQNFVPPGQTNVVLHFVNIIIDSKYKSTVKIDNQAPASSFTDIPGTNYAYLQENVTTSSATNPVHRVTADTTFSVLVYGYGNVESYGYNGGTNVKDLYQFASIQNQYATVDVPSTCKNSPFQFYMTFPYQPTQINWVFGVALNSQGIQDTTLNNPVADSAYWVNGKQVYRYRLPSTYQIKQTGTYPIKVIAQNPTPEGCSGEQQIDYDLKVLEKPNADFAYTTAGCLGDSVHFTNQSNAYGRAVLRWLWDFGDRQTAAVSDPGHTYTAANSYKVNFNLITDIGCLSDTATKTVQINSLPVVRFGVSAPTCAGRDIQFTDASSVANASLVKWTWNFGDRSGGATATSPVHNYADTGTYSVKVILETDKGCKDSLSKAVSVHPVPKVGFMLPGNCINDPLTTFADTSAIADGSQAQFTWLWNFGDPNALPINNTSTVQNGQHRYTATGGYNVALKVTSKDGCADSLTQVFTLNGAVPIPQFSFQNGVRQCANDSVAVLDNSSVTPGNLVNLEIYWDYTNDPTNKTVVNNPKKGSTYKHAYPDFFSPSTQSYRVKLVTYSGVNCLAETDTVITLNASPDIQFKSIAPLCANVPALALQASVQNMTAGNGVFSGKGVTPAGVFNPAAAGAGQYVLRYTYTSATGCSSYKEQPVVVYPVPVVSAGPDKVVLEGGYVTLNGTATGNALQYLWTPATALNNPAVAQPVAAPTDDIDYTLTVTSGDGCVALDNVLVKVLKTPTVPNAFSPNGDGVHDRWEIPYLDSYHGATVEIFNRYGQKVFESKGYAKAWDGTRNGNPLPVGTYYYLIDPKNGRKQISGFVDLIR